MAHTYTCTNATGDIVGVVNTSATACIKYSLSGTSAGSVEGNTEDGIYEKIGDSNITLDGYTGVVYVVSGGRVEQRILTHNANVLGSELYAGWSSHLSGNETSTSNAIATGFHCEVTVVGTSLERPIVYNNMRDTLAVGTYTIIFDAVVSGTCIISKIRLGNEVLNTDHTVVNGSNTLVLTTGVEGPSLSFYFDGRNIFDVDMTNISVKEIYQEDKLYINGVLQTETPTLPTGTLVANEIASIGYPDTVTRHHGDLVVRTDALSGAVIAYNSTWVDENDDEWVDENSNSWLIN